MLNVDEIMSDYPERLRGFKENILKHLQNENLSSSLKETLRDLFSEYQELSKRREKYDERIKNECRQREVCQNLLSVRGIGELTATILATVDPHVFKNGREFSAWLGLTPKEVSSGGKRKLLGISKRGDRYIRQLLVHGARVVLH